MRPFRFGVCARLAESRGEWTDKAHRARWGVSYFVVFEPAVEAFAPLVARLTGE